MNEQFRKWFERFNKKTFFSAFVISFVGALLANLSDSNHLGWGSFLSIGILCLIVSGIIALVKD